ncbi:MAG: hypothetical protein ABR926_26190, partial [Streptosporangiaceae bacterium]
DARLRSESVLQAAVDAAAAHEAPGGAPAPVVPVPDETAVVPVPDETAAVPVPDETAAGGEARPGGRGSPEGVSGPAPPAS